MKYREEYYRIRILSKYFITVDARRSFFVAYETRCSQCSRCLFCHSRNNSEKLRVPSH